MPKAAPNRLTRALAATLIASACLAMTADGMAQQQPSKKQSQQAKKPAPAAAPAATPGDTGETPTGPVDSTGSFSASGFPTIETEAKFAYIIDATTGTVLLDKNGNQRMFPSSMTKMLTSHIVFEKLKKGDLRLEDELSVSENAWRKQGSKMFVELNGRVSVADLLRGVIISSGNDACIVLAEALAGSEEAFAEEMNRKAKEIGMTNTNFRNSTGWPDPEHTTTSKDLATLALSTIRKFPEYYYFYSEKEFTYHGIKQGNRNPLLYANMGADGLKTGHTEISGYGLTGSILRGDRRLVMVINGLPSMKARGLESRRLMDWAFREFENYALFKAGDVVDQAKVFLGTEKTVPLTVGESALVTLPRRSRKDMKVELIYPSPIPAPIQKGAQVAKLKISAPGVPSVELPVLAGADVGQLGFIGRVGASLSNLLFGSGG